MVLRAPTCLPLGKCWQQFVFSFLRQKHPFEEERGTEEKEGNSGGKKQTPEEHAVTKMARRDQCFTEESLLCI